MIKLKIKKGDQVIVVTGKNKGRKGQVLKVFPKESKVLVAGVNVVKKHTKPNHLGEGGIVSKESRVHVSNIAHVDPKTGVATKVGFKILEDGLKVRVAKKSGEIIDSREGK